jgi:hypothetical protein
MRSFVIKNISFENLTRTDLLARGWHRSGYLFGITGADTDGWVDGRLALNFPATLKFKTAMVEVVRFPSPKDYPLSVSVNGGKDTTADARARADRADPDPAFVDLRDPRGAGIDQSFPLDAPDTRSAPTA